MLFRSYTLSLLASTVITLVFLPPIYAILSRKRFVNPSLDPADAAPASES